MKLRCMHLTFFLTIASVWFSTNIFTSNPATPMFSVLSWNILGPNTQDVNNFFPGTKGIYTRLDEIIKIIKKARASILCLQEVDTTSLKILERNLSTFFLITYQPKGKNGGVAIFAKTTDFDKTQSNGLGLNLGNGGTAAIARLFSIKSNAIIGVSSVHINRSDIQSPESSLSGREQIISLLNQLDPNIPQIITGDFNINAVEFQTQTIPEMNHNFSQQFTELLSFSNFMTANKSDGSLSKTDHILHTTNLTPVIQHSKILPDSYNPSMLIHQQMPSDHRPLHEVFIDHLAAAQPAPAPAVISTTTSAVALPAKEPSQNNTTIATKDELQIFEQCIKEIIRQKHTPQYQTANVNTIQYFHLYSKGLFDLNLFDKCLPQNWQQLPYKTKENLKKRNPRYLRKSSKKPFCKKSL